MHKNRLRDPTPIIVYAFPPLAKAIFYFPLLFCCGSNSFLSLIFLSVHLSLAVATLYWLRPSVCQGLSHHVLSIPDKWRCQGLNLGYSACKALPLNLGPSSGLLESGRDTDNFVILAPPSSTSIFVPFPDHCCYYVFTQCVTAMQTGCVPLSVYMYKNHYCYF